MDIRYQAERRERQLERAISSILKRNEGSGLLQANLRFFLPYRAFRKLHFTGFPSEDFLVEVRWQRRVQIAVER